MDDGSGDMGGGERRRRPRGWHLAMEVPGAAAEDVQRGIDAAQALLDAAGVTPLEAAAAHFKRAGEQEDLTEAEGRAAILWDEARHVAAEACCAGMTTMPEYAYLEIHPDDDNAGRD